MTCINAAGARRGSNEAMNALLMRATGSLLAAPFLAAAVTVLADEPAAPPGESPAQLETIVVHPLTPPLDESRRLLRLLVESSSPCLGCDAVLVPAHESPALSLLKYMLVPTPPPEMDEGARLLMDLRTSDDRTLEYLRP